MKFLIFDTETTGLPRNARISAVKEKGNWPDLVSISWILYEDNIMIGSHSYIVRPDGWEISEEVTKIHGISHSFAVDHGMDLLYVLKAFYEDVDYVDCIVAHNIHFDMNVINNATHWRTQEDNNSFRFKENICTAQYGKNITKISSKFGFKFPKLSELYTFVMKKEPSLTLHNSLNDTMILAELFFHLPIYNELIGKKDATVQNIQSNRLRIDCSSSS